MAVASSRHGTDHCSIMDAIELDGSDSEKVVGVNWQYRQLVSTLSSTNDRESEKENAVVVLLGCLTSALLSASSEEFEVGYDSTIRNSLASSHSLKSVVDYSLLV